MANPPSGTVTFLFTDIEGSTKRWEAHPQQMQAALQRHDVILRSAIEAEGGHVFKTVGDAFCAAFSSPHHALQAALDSQRGLDKEQWPDAIGSVKVRMALHTGAVDEQGGDYFGQPPNRVARLLSAGHGGQTLISLATQELVRDNLPAGVSLLDLGEHRLKDLIRPERVFQLVAPGLPSEFPQLKTLDSRPHNLPVQPTPLIGREKELAEVEKMLARDDVRLLSLTGPGGTGKTRLALQAAAGMLDAFEDGVFFINLAPLSDPNLVLPTVAQALDLKEEGSRPVLEMLKSYLRDKKMLLLLDNFEQVVEARGAVTDLLSATDHLKVLVTSRVKLQVRGEQEYPVPSLGLPPVASAREGPLSVESLTQYEAVRLFIERAQSVKPDFTVTNDNAPAIAEICHRLDGLPLAIELAAARIKLLPPAAMLARLGSRLKLLSGGLKDLPARQQTLRAAIEWSYDLLSGEEKKLFRRLAVFVGGRTLEAIEAICNAESDLEIDVLEGVSSLLDKSLLRQEEGVGGEPRFVMLETIHEYAHEKLEESGEAEVLRRLHALYFMALAEGAEPHLVAHNQVEWMDRLEEEIDNLRACLDWSLAAPRTGGEAAEEQVVTGLRLAAALSPFWSVRGYGQEIYEKLVALLAHPAAAERTLYRSRALTVAGRFSGGADRSEHGWELCEEAVSIARESGDQLVLARAVHWLGIIAKQARPQVAGELLREALELSREMDDKWGIAHALGDLGAVASLQGNRKEARKLYTEALEISRQIGERWYAIRLLYSLGNSFTGEGQHQTAYPLYEEALQIARDLKDKRQTAQMVAALGKSYLLEGKKEDGQAMLAEAMSLTRQLPGKHHLLNMLQDASCYASQAGAYDEARAWGEEYLRLSDEAQSKYHSGNARANLAPVYIHEGDLRGAHKLFCEGLGLFTDLANNTGTFECLIGLGVVASEGGQGEKALRLFGAAAALEETPGAMVGQTAVANQYRDTLGRLRAEVEEEVFAAEWDKGRAMSMEQAIKYALQETTDAS